MAPPEPSSESEEDPNAAHAEAIRDKRVHLDLLSLAHLADIERGGLYLDFGTPARAKYTNGDWRNEWLGDHEQGERTFTRMGQRASLWFHQDEASPVTFHLTLRRVGATSLAISLNGETVGTLELRDGLYTYTVAVPGEQVRAGENELSFFASGEGANVSLELDAVWVAKGAGAGAETDAAPSYRRSLGQVRVAEGDQGARRAWSVDPGTRIRHYIEVPPTASLSFGLATTAGDGPSERPRAQVVASPAGGGSSVELWSGPVPNRWEDHWIDLGALAGQVIRLEFVVEGTGDSEVGWSAPQVLVPLPTRSRVPGEARSAVVLTIDTLRASKLRPYNRRSRVQTPAFDAFAEGATLFENAQAPENWTKPSVASILTSLTPTSHGTKEDASSLPSAALTLGEVYSEAGFSTAAFLANGYVSDRFGFDQGWDHHTNYIREERNTEARTVFREAADWIDAHKDERFFVYIQTIDPHVPYDPPDELLELYDPDHASYDGQVSNRRTGLLLGEAKSGRLSFTDADARRLEALHDAEITYHDRHFGPFLERLRELGLYEDLVFVVTSDHGEEFDEHGSWGHGHSIFQELLHVPLVVRWPAAEAAGHRVPATVSTMDIGPTILEATGLPIPEAFEGRSLLGFLRGAPPPGPRVAFSDFLEDRRVIRAGRHKLVLRGNHTWAMFDLAQDPGEQDQLDGAEADPIALRYCRILLGQFLGADDRGAWLAPDGEGSAGTLLPASDSVIDPQLCEQLQMLGYVDARCDDA